MIERKFIESKKIEFEIKEFIKNQLGKGKVSNISIERTPIGERIIIYTSKPGLVIGRKGAVIQDITAMLKKQFKLENPKLEIAEIPNIEFDAQTVADLLALSLERFGPSTFKMRAYRTLDRIKAAGALGAEIILSGKLPGERARAWRFAFGYMKKTGEISIVNKAQAIAKTIPGIVGIKIMIVPKDAKIPDKIEILPPEMQIKEEIIKEPEKKEEVEEKREIKEKKKSGRKKELKKSGDVSETEEVSIEEKPQETLSAKKTRKKIKEKKEEK